MKFWKRQATLQIGSKRFGMDDLYFKFTVPFEDSEKLGTATIEAYNLSPATRNSIKKGMPIILNAGYEGDIGAIFTGKVSQVSDKHSGTEVITTIAAAEALEEWLSKEVNKTYTAGSKASAIVKDLLNIFGLEVGTMELAVDKEYPRGKVCKGKVKNVLTEIVTSDCKSRFLIRNGIVTINDPKTGTKTGYVLSAESGLLQATEATDRTETTTRQTTVKDGKEKQEVTYKRECLLNYHLAPADVVQTLKQRLAGVQIPVLLDSTYFASFLKQDKLNLFPAAAYTERPATACARICEGKIVILVSGSPLAMVVPSFFAEHFECLDDYSSGAVFAGLIRLLKYLAFLLAVFGPGLYVMAVSFAPELIPVHLLAKLAQGEASTPLPPMPEMLAVTLLLEIVREAGLRAPKSISHTVSLVGALIIGETAVSAGIISVPVLTMAAAATIATLAVPALYEQSILFRFAVILLAGLFGVPGLACGALLILAMACGSDPFGYDYLYPLMPPGKAALRDGFVRAIWSRLAQKGEVLPRHAKE